MSTCFARREYTGSGFSGCSIQYFVACLYDSACAITNILLLGLCCEYVSLKNRVFGTLQFFQTGPYAKKPLLSLISFLVNLLDSDWLKTAPIKH
jgi:hypothetical protein